jgi:hypothetical protein
MSTFHSPVQSSDGWKAIERSLAAQARAQKLCEESERLREASRNARAESRQLRAACRGLKGEAAAVNQAERLAPASNTREAALSSL